MAGTVGKNEAELRAQLQQRQVEEEAEATVSWGEVIKYMFFLVILSVVVLNQVLVDDSYEIGSAVSDAISHGSYMDFDEIYSSDDVKEWLVEEFLPTLIKTANDVPAVITNSTVKRRLTNFNRILTPLRLVQKRMQLTDNPSDNFKDFVPKVWKGSSIGMFSSSGNEDVEPYGPWLLFKFDPNSGAYGEGGFTQIIYLESIEQATRDLEFIIQNEWIDRQTNPLYADLTAYNGHFNMMTYISAQFTITKSGYVKKQLLVVPMRLEVYLTAGDFLRLAGEIIYLILTILYTAIELYQIKLIVGAKALEFKAKNLAVHKKGMKLLTEALKTYFADGWNYLDVASLILSYAAIGLWLQYVFSPLVVGGKTPSDWELTNEMVYLSLTYRNYIRINAFNFFLVFLRLIKYLGIFDRVRLLISTLGSSSGQVLYFLALIVAVFLSFVIYGHIAFGSSSELFYTFGDSIVECLLIFFGSFDGLRELREENASLFLIYFIPYTVLTVLILSNMFIAIISGAYRKAWEKNESRRKPTELPTHITIRLLHFAKNITKRIRLVFKRDEKAIQKYIESEKQIRLEENALEGHGDFNEDYEKVVEFTERIDKDVDTGKEIEGKTTRIRKKKEGELMKVVRFLGVIALFVAVVLWQQDIETGFALQTSVREEIEDITFRDSLKFKDIYDYDTLTAWFSNFHSCIHISYDDLRYYVANKLYLFGQETNRTAIRVSIRRIKLHDNESKRYGEYEPLIRNPIGFDPATSSHDDEDTDDILLPNSTLTYTYDKGYFNGGAFLVYFSPEELQFLKEFSEFEEMELLDQRTNSLAIDMVTYNKDLNYFVYSAMIFQFGGGGRIRKWIEVTPLQFQHYYRPIDQARAFFEILLLLVLVASISFRVITMRRKWTNYTSWCKKKYDSLSPAQIRKRRRVKPEWIRRLQCVFSLFVLIELTAYAMAIVCAGMWIAIISIDDSHAVIEYESVEFFDVFGYYAPLRRAYQVVTSITGLLLCFRLMKYLQLNKALSLLSDTLSIAARDIFYYLFILISVLLGFVFMAYLSFGMTLEHYCTISNAFMYCFQIIVGSYDYFELERVDSVMAPLFFFLLSLLFTFVLLNIFIAILEKAYSIAKEKAASDDEYQVTIIQALWTFCLRICRKKPNLVEKNPEHFREYTDFGFHRMTSGLNDIVTEEEWGTMYAEQIMLERNRRREMQLDLEDATRERKMEEMYRPSLTGSRMKGRELQTRLQYWMYLRAGYRHFQSQEAKIYKRIEKIREEQIQREQEQMTQLQGNTNLSEEIKTLEQELEAISERISATEEMITQKQQLLAKKSGK